MQRTIRAGRDVVAGACLDVKFVEEFSLSTAHSPAAAAPDTTNSEVARNPEVGSMADGLNMNGLRVWVYSHGRVTPAGSLHRFWRSAGRCGFGGRFEAFRRVE